MSLGVAVKGPEGIVLAADSRITLFAQFNTGNQLPVYFDNATKLFSFTNESHKHIGIVTYGQAVIGGRSAHSFLPELENVLISEFGDERQSTRDYADLIRKFFKQRWNEFLEHQQNTLIDQIPPMVFIVGGYDPGKPYSTVFRFSLPQDNELEERNPGDSNFGISWGGQLEYASRLLHGYDPRILKIIKETLAPSAKQMKLLESKLKQNVEMRVPYDVLPLQDCINLAILLIKTTISAQDLAIDVRGVGGLIELATITRSEGFSFVQKKNIKGEF